MCTYEALAYAKLAKFVNAVKVHYYEIFTVNERILMRRNDAVLASIISADRKNYILMAVSKPYILSNIYRASISNAMEINSITERRETNDRFKKSELVEFLLVNLILIRI